MKFDTNLFQDLSQLNKTEIVKRLQDAVRQTQGTKRASWAPNSRPFWWIEEHEIEIGNGQTIKSLKFESKSKANWDVERARTTLLLYMHRNSLPTNATQNTQQLPSTKSEPTSQTQNCPPPSAATRTRRKRNLRRPKNENLAHDDTENDQKATKASPKKITANPTEPIIVSSDEEDEEAIDKIQGNVPTEQKDEPLDGTCTTRTGRRRRRVRVAAAQKDNAKCIIQNKAERSSTPPDVESNKRSSGQTDETAIDTRAVQDDVSDHKDSEMSQSDESIEETDEVSGITHEATEDEENARLQKSIKNQKAALQAQVTQELKKLDRRVKVKRDEIMRQLAVEIEAVQSAHAVARFQLSKEACDTPLVQYINECNADSREWLLKMVAGRATRTLEDLDVVEDRNASRTESQQARMNEALKTARKVTRAARQREIDDGRCKVPTMMTRSRPTRTAAKTAVKRNQEIFGREGRNVETVRVTRRRARGNVENGTGALETPVAAGADSKSHTEAMQKFIELLRTQPNPEKFVEKCWSVFNEEQAEK